MDDFIKNVLIAHAEQLLLFLNLIVILVVTILRKHKLAIVLEIVAIAQYLLFTWNTWFGLFLWIFHN